MCLLSEKEIAIVVQDVKSAGINYSHLSADLIDHICCDIESKMANGLSFDRAYSMAKKEYNIKGLLQIQKDTLMLIDKNYRIMKKSMKTIGVLAMALMAFGALFKIYHWPGAAALLAISFFFVSLVFFPSLLFVMYKEVNNKKQAGIYVAAFLGGFAFISGTWFKLMHWPGTDMVLISGFAFIILVLLPIIMYTHIKKSSLPKNVLLLGFIPLIFYVAGVLFKLQHWPGASVLLMSSSLFLILGFVPAYYKAEIKKSENLRIDFIFGIIILVYFVVLSFLLQVNNNNRPYSNPEEQMISYNQITTLLQIENQQLLMQHKDSTLLELNNTTDSFNSQLIKLKTIIITDNNKDTQKSTEDKSILQDPYLILKPDRDNKDLKTTLTQIKESIDSYIASYNSIEGITQSGFHIDKLINASVDSGGKAPIQIFDHQSTFAVLTQISFLQYQLQLAENIQLRAFINNQNPE